LIVPGSNGILFNVLQTGGFKMKKRILIILGVILFLGTATLAFAGDNPLKAQEKKVNAS